MRVPLALSALILLPLAGPAWAVPVAADIERVAVRAAQVLDGVLRDCPASFVKIGSEAKRCVGAASTVEEVRVTLGAALSGDLYGVWRSRDGQVSVFNWARTPAGYVYLRVQPDPDGRARTLVYVDVPPGSAPAAGTQIGSVTLTPVPGSGPADTPAPVSPAPSAPVPSTPVPSTSAPATPTPVTPATSTPAAETAAPVPFRRVLGVTTPRMNGSDVLAVQNRLISLMRPARPGRGDGWFGPVTAATVRAFQQANGLPVTGRVDQATWNRLFSASARSYVPPSTP